MKKLILMAIAVILLGSFAWADEKTELQIKNLELLVLQERLEKVRARSQVLEMAIPELEKAVKEKRAEIQKLSDKMKGSDKAKESPKAPENKPIEKDKGGK